MSKGMELEEAIDIIDKELHKKWDKSIEKKDGMTYIHLGDEEQLTDFEAASQRCLVEVQVLQNKNKELLNEIEKLKIENNVLRSLLPSDRYSYGVR